MTDRDRRRLERQARDLRTAATAGLVAVAAIGLGILGLRDLPSAHRLGALDAWVDEIWMSPGSASASAVMLAVGLVAVAVWALTRFAGSRVREAGGLAIAGGALLSAGAQLAPLLVAFRSGSGDQGARVVARALLGSSLALDCAFHLGLGVGLIAIAARWSHADGPPWARGLALAGGVMSLPVALQSVWFPAASLQLLSIPLALAFVAQAAVDALPRVAQLAPVRISARP